VDLAFGSQVGLGLAHTGTLTDGILMELFLDVDEYGAEAMVKMCKILLGVVVILKVHEVYGKREVRPALLVNDEEKIRT